MNAPSLRWPSQRHLVRYLRCGNCGVAVIVSAVPTVDEPLAEIACLLCSRYVVGLKHDTWREPMTSEQFRALPTDYRAQKQATIGRPPGPTPTMKLCSDCGVREIRTKNERCIDCWRRLQDDRSLASRIVALLRDGPRYRVDLCEVLGVDVDFLRQGINNARKAGHNIVLTGKRQGLYSLEGETVL